MKKLLFIFSTGLLFTACGSEKSEYESAYDKDREPTEEPNIAQEPSIATNSASGAAAGAGEFEKGAHLISLSDCLSCHDVENKIVGPSYTAVAEKYEFNDKNVDHLAGKIINGGSGVWGDLAMAPHPDLNQEDAREMAKYVLSLRNDK